MRAKLEGESEIRKSWRERSLSNFQIRLITGLIIALFTLGITYIGDWEFRLFCFCLGGAVLHEWHEIVKGLHAPAAAISAWVCFILLCVAALTGIRDIYIVAVLAAGIIISFSIAAWERNIKAAVIQSGGLFYASLLPLALPYLRGGAGQAAAIGLYWVFFLYIAVWATDVGAYLFGRALGGPKLAPRISPNKTWSGAWGGILCSVAGAVCFLFWASSDAHFLIADIELRDVLNWKLLIPAAFLLSLVAQAGDLLESWFKRRFNVKDSGHILPGHGGIMDRVDGLLPAAAVFAILLNLFSL